MARDRPTIRVRRRRKLVAVPVPIDRGFRLDVTGRRTLVTPHPEAAWGSTPAWFRSLVYDRDGSVVSVGLPKFHDVDRPLVPVEELRERWDDVVVEEKLDGRLIVRSLWNGAVWWRTRNSLHADDHLADVEGLLGATSLSDPAAWGGGSIQMELCLPRERVVIAHAEPSIRVLGRTDHETLGPLEDGWEEALVGEGIPVPERTPASRWASLEGLVADVDGWVDREGVVLRLDGIPLARIKSRDYRLRHALRFGFPPSLLSRVSERRLEALLEGADPELATTVRRMRRAIAESPDRHALVRELAAATAEPWDRLVARVPLCDGNPAGDGRLV